MFRDLDTGEWTVVLAWYQINNQVLMHQSLAKCIPLNQRPKGHTENRSRNPHMHMSIDNKHWQCVSIIHVKTLPGRIVPFIRQYWWPWMCSKVKVTVKKETRCRTGNWCPHYQKIHRQHKVFKIQYFIWNKISIDLFSFIRMNNSKLFWQTWLV